LRCRISEREAERGWCVDAEAVVALSDVLDEGASDDDDLRHSVISHLLHRS
jgi:hypothetical protein